MIIVDNLVTTRETRDRLGTVALDELRFQVRLPKRVAVLMATGKGEKLISRLFSTTPEKRTL